MHALWRQPCTTLCTAPGQVRTCRSSDSVVAPINDPTSECMQIRPEIQLMPQTRCEGVEPSVVVAAAVNDAVRKVEANSKNMMKDITGGIDMPAGFKMPF